VPIFRENHFGWSFWWLECWAFAGHTPLCSVPVDNGPHYVLDGTANEIWPKKATSVGTGAFGPVISIHVSVCRSKSNLSWACWWTLCTPRRQLCSAMANFLISLASICYWTPQHWRETNAVYKKLMGFSGKNLKIFGNYVVPRTGRRWITWCPGPWDTLLGLDIIHMGGFLNGCQKPIGFITQMVQWLGWFGGTTMTGWKPPYLLISKHIDDPGADVPLVNGAPREASCRFQRHLEWNLGVLMTPTSSVGHFLRSPISRNSKNGLLICCSMSILSTLIYI